MWNCSVDLLGKIVIFEPGIAFPLQTLARRSHHVMMNWVSFGFPCLFAFGRWPFCFWGFWPLVGVSCLRILTPLCCVRAKDWSWRLRSGVEVETSFWFLRFWFSNLGFWSRKLDFITDVWDILEKCHLYSPVVKPWRDTCIPLGGEWPLESRQRAWTWGRRTNNCHCTLVSTREQWWACGMLTRKNQHVSWCVRCRLELQQAYTTFLRTSSFILFEALIANLVLVWCVSILEQRSWRRCFGGLKTGPPRRHRIQSVEGPVLDPRAKETCLKRVRRWTPLKSKMVPPGGPSFVVNGFGIGRRHRPLNNTRKPLKRVLIWVSIMLRKKNHNKNARPFVDPRSNQKHFWIGPQFFPIPMFLALHVIGMQAGNYTSSLKQSWILPYGSLSSTLPWMFPSSTHLVPHSYVLIPPRI